MTAKQFNGSMTELKPFKVKIYAVEVGGLRLPITVSFKGAPSHCDLFVTFSETKRNLTRQKCSLYLHNSNSFVWPEIAGNKRIGDIERARHGTVYYIAFESSMECILNLALHQKESDLMNQTLSSGLDGLGLQMQQTSVVAQKSISIKEQQKQFKDLHILIKELVNEENQEKLAKYLVSTDNLKRQRDQENSLNRSILTEDEQLGDEEHSGDESNVIIKKNTVVASQWRDILFHKRIQLSHILKQSEESAKQRREAIFK